MANKIDCEIGYITYSTENSLQLVQLMENLEEAIRKLGAKKVSELLLHLKSQDETTAIKEIEEDNDDKDRQIIELESKIEELEEEIESDTGLTIIDFGYDKLYWKSDSIKIQSLMDDFNKVHGIKEMEEA